MSLEYEELSIQMLVKNAIKNYEYNFSIPKLTQKELKVDKL